MCECTYDGNNINAETMVKQRLIKHRQRLTLPRNLRSLKRKRKLVKKNGRLLLRKVLDQSLNRSVVLSSSSDILLVGSVRDYTMCLSVCTLMIMDVYILVLL